MIPSQVSDLSFNFTKMDSKATYIEDSYFPLRIVRYRNPGRIFIWLINSTNSIYLYPVKQRVLIKTQTL
jgi:hypothetical protein